ncbi:hypothetical protein ZIOFF_045600 [Zingiber officinale]|uniref:Uncharacterized protein n=1 Tax=Zingiber officinale TaxID=94328 RepID=A0A8J5L1B5_ZINOF|nr:hypothetical protein ZIOFF_045600 [Zingiber officinale]
MPWTAFSSSSNCPRIDVAVDMGNPFLNRTVDGFLKIGAVAASRVAAEETFHFLQKGTVSGVYVGVEYGMERVRGTKDWKNAMLGGAVTGLLISVTSNNNKEKVFKDAITAGAVATAAEFINYLT